MLILVLFNKCDVCLSVVNSGHSGDGCLVCLSRFYLDLKVGCGIVCFSWASV